MDATQPLRSEMTGLFFSILISIEHVFYAGPQKIAETRSRKKKGGEGTEELSFS
jgi:hypothetical protein